MCVKLKGSELTPGQVFAFLTMLGKASASWGFRNGKQYNVRMDSIPTVWKKYQYNRGVLSVDSFWEKEKQFVSQSGNLLKLAVLYNEDNEFAVITTDATPIVKPYHHRMPFLLTDKGAEDFLNNQDPIELGFDQIKLVA
jgi:putative SOS response-associated peptidase YedK